MCAEITVQVTECEVVSCSEWRWFKLYEMRFELTWHQNPQTETCCSRSSVCSRCVWAGYALCTVAFGTAVATTQGLYHMLARTKAQSGGCTRKRGNHTHSGLCLLHIKVNSLFPKGTWTNIFQELEHKVMLEKVPRWGKSEHARDRRACDSPLQLPVILWTFNKLKMFFKLK